MLRGEKRAMANAVGTDGAGPPSKKAKEKIPDFDWSANNYELTWRLVDELKKSENKAVLFPDLEGSSKGTGETKEDVYRRIAKVVHPEAYTTDPHTTGSRMKNKNVAMWKEYSGYCRKLQDLCATHQVVLPTSGPEESSPPALHDEWRKIVISMPAFPTLYTFMPVRAEDKPKISTTRSQQPLRVTPVALSHTPMEEDYPLDQHVENQSASGLQLARHVSSPTVQGSSITNGMGAAAVNGMGVAAVNGNGEGHGPIPNDRHVKQLPNSVPAPFQKIITLHDYLELRRSYQEDVRLGIFTPSEAKANIEALDKQKAFLEGTRFNTTPANLPTPPPTAYGQQMANTSRVQEPELQRETSFEEKAMLLGFRKPQPPHPLAGLTFKDFYKAILDHAAVCDFQECRLDTRKKFPRLAFLQSANPNELGLGLEIVIQTRTGPVPLLRHAPAACARFASRGSLPIMDVPLALRSSGCETTVWDHAHTVLAASLTRLLTIDEIKTVQNHAHSIPIEPPTRQRLLMLNERSTLFDVLRTGVLFGNSWEPGGSTTTVLENGMVHHHQV